MKLSTEQVEHIAVLARLNLTEQEKQEYREQLSAILDYVEKLGKADTDMVEPTSQVTGLVNVMREDEVIESGISQELVKAAPESQSGHIRIPKIFDNK